MAVVTINIEELELQTILNENPDLFVLEKMVRLEQELGYLPRGWNYHWLNMDTSFELTSSASMSGQRTSDTVAVQTEEEDNEPVEKSNSCFWR